MSSPAEQPFQGEYAVPRERKPTFLERLAGGRPTDKHDQAEIIRRIEYAHRRGHRSPSRGGRKHHAPDGSEGKRKKR